MGNVSDLYTKLEPYIIETINRTNRGPIRGNVSGSSIVPSPHDLQSAHHSGTISNAQGPQFLLTDGSRALTGNLAVNSGITIDGVDISVHAADPNAHHARSHVITSASDHTIDGSNWDLVANVSGAVGLRTPLNDVSGATKEAILKSNASGLLKLVDLQATAGVSAATLTGSTSTTTPLITATAALSIQPTTDLTLDPGGLVYFPQAQTVRSTNFNSGIPIYGWAFTQYAGSSDYNLLSVSAIQADELRVRLFVADEVRVDRGEWWLTKNYGIVETTFTIPTVINNTVNVWFEDSAALLGQPIFTNGDVLHIRLFGWTTGVRNLWFTVATYVDGVDRQQWTLTLKYDSHLASGGTVTKGVTANGWGALGQGYIHQSVVDPAGSPYFDIKTWSGSGYPWPGGGATIATKLRLGYLSSLTDPNLSPTGWGLYAQNVFLTGKMRFSAGAGDTPLVVTSPDNANSWFGLSAYTLGGTINSYRLTNDNLNANAGSSFLDLRMEDNSFGSVDMRVLGGNASPYPQDLALVMSHDLNNAAVGLGVTEEGIGFAAIHTSGWEWHWRSYQDSGAGIRFEVANDLQVGGDILRISGTGTQNIGSSGTRFNTLYVTTIDALYTSSTFSLSGQTWDYTGTQMYIRATSGAAHSTLYIANPDATYKMNLDVENNIIVGGTVDGVDVSAHAADVNAHHNQTHLLANATSLGTDHTVSGLTAGHVLRATGATTAAFQAIVDADLPATIVRTSVTLTAGAGIAGGGDLSASRTFSINAGTLISIGTDSVGIADGANYQFIGTGAGLTAGWRNVSELAGAGLGAATGVLAVGAGTLVAVAADTVGIATGANYQFIGTGAGTSAQWVNLSTLAGAGFTHTSGVFDIGAGTLMAVAADTVGIAAGVAYQFIGTGAGTAAAWQNISTLAGAGMTQTNGVLNVIAGTMITVNADDVAITAGANYQFIGTGGGTAAAWQNLSGLAGAGMTATSGVLNVIAGSGITVNADDVALTWGTPTISTIAPDDAANAGASANPARSDHKHAIAAAAPGANSVNLSASVEGSASSFARSDHTHSLDVSIAPTWTGSHTFQNNTIARLIRPELTDTYDLGTSVYWWRQQFVSQINAVIFAEQTASLLGGWLYIPKDAGTVGAVSSGATTVDFGKAMTVGDFVVIKSHDTGGAIKTEYMTVGTLISGTTYNVTRDLAGAHVTDPAWADGTPFAVLGQSGAGRIELNAYDTPRIQLIQQGGTYNAQTELLRIGDLNGGWGYGAETYGIAIGARASSNVNITLEATNGFRIFNNATQLAQWDTAGKITVGEVANSRSRIEIDSSTGINFINRNGSGVDSTVISLTNAGAGNFSGAITASSGSITGTLAISGSGKITAGNSTIDTTGLAAQISGAWNWGNGVRLLSSTTVIGGMWGLDNTATDYIWLVVNENTSVQTPSISNRHGTIYVRSASTGAYTGTTVISAYNNTSSTLYEAAITLVGNNGSTSIAISANTITMSGTFSAAYLNTGTLNDARLPGTMSAKTFSGVITSTVTTGTAPLSIASTTLVNNLNVQYFNGQISTYYTNATNIASGTLADGRLPGIISAKTFSGVITSAITTGTAPFSIASTTVNTNLNSDYVDGLHGTQFLRNDTANTAGSAITFTNGWDSNAACYLDVAPAAVGAYFRSNVAADAVNTMRDAPLITWRGYYWNGSSSVTLDASLNLDITAVSPLAKFTFDLAGVERMSIANSGIITGAQFQSTVATGGAPFLCASTTAVTNLNADYVDGIHGTSFLRSDAADSASGLITFSAGFTTPGPVQVTSTVAPASGTGVELGYVSGSAWGYIQAYDRSTPGYKDFVTIGLAHVYQRIGANIVTDCDSNGFRVTATAGADPYFYVVEQDNGASYGGRLVLGRNTNASTPASGTLQIHDKSGTWYFVWPDDNGTWRIGTTSPTSANDQSGTIVGTQTSNLAFKEIVGVPSTEEGYAATMRAALAVRDFRYLDKRFRAGPADEEGKVQRGIVVNYAPEFGLDYHPDYPDGKVLDEVTSIGNIILAIAHLGLKLETQDQKIRRLEARITELESRVK